MEPAEPPAMVPEPTGVLCCGKHRDTPYCPFCGEKLPKTPIQTLLTHLRTQIQVYQRRINNYEGPDGLSPRQQGLLERHKRNHAKWLAWKAAVESLMDV